jgi:hypothetical protein
MHHGLYDAWGLEQILRQVVAIYAGESVKSPLRFAEFVRHVSAVDNDEAREFWRRYLENSPSSEFPRRPLKSLGQPRGRVSSTLSLKKIPQNMTLATLVRASWAILISRYEGSNDVVFGITLNRRNVDMPDILEVVGPAITTVPTRVKLDPKLQIRLLLE